MFSSKNILVTTDFSGDRHSDNLHYDPLTQKVTLKHSVLYRSSVKR